MDFLLVVFVHFKGTIEQPHLKLYRKNTPYTLVDNRFRQPALLYQFYQMFISIGTGCFHIHSGCYSLKARFLWSVGRMVKIVHHTYRPIVGEYISVEPPFVAEYILQQPFTGMDRHTVYLMVTGHNTIDIGLLNRRLKRIKMIFPQFSFSYQYRSNVNSGFGLGIGDKMLSHGRQLSGSYSFGRLFRLAL